MSITQASPCFSGTCGLCLNCCGTIALHKTPPKQSTRAKDLYKFYKGTLDSDYDEYWKKLHYLKKSSYFTTPETDSLLHKEYGISRYYDGEEYAKTSWKLLPSNQGEVCQMPKCQMFHEHTHEYKREPLYTNIPLYQSNTTLCAVCIREYGEKWFHRL